MNCKRLIFLIILVFLIIVFIYFIYSKNKIRTYFSIENVKIEKNENYKKSFLDFENTRDFLTYDFKNMPKQEKEKFLNNPNQYECYELSLTAKNKSNYNAVADCIYYIDKIEGVWMNEELGVIAPYNVKTNSQREISTEIICKKGVLENNIQPKFELRLLIVDCPFEKEIKLKN